MSSKKVNIKITITFNQCKIESKYNKTHMINIYLYQTERIIYKYYYLKDKFCGKAIGYHENGIIKSKCYYINGIKNGSDFRYDKNNNITNVYNYIDGKLNGYRS